MTSAQLLGSGTDGRFMTCTAVVETTIKRCARRAAFVCQLPDDASGSRWPSCRSHLAQMVLWVSDSQPGRPAVLVKPVGEP